MGTVNSPQAYLSALSASLPTYICSFTDRIGQDRTDRTQMNERLIPKVWLLDELKPCMWGVSGSFAGSAGDSEYCASLGII